MWLLVLSILPVAYGFSLKPEVIGIKNNDGVTEATIKFKRGYSDYATVLWRVNGIRVINGTDGIEITKTFKSGFNLRGTSVSYRDDAEPDERRHFVAIKIPASFDVTSLTAIVERGYQRATMDINTSSLSPGNSVVEKITDTALGRASLGCGVLSGFTSR